MPPDSSSSAGRKTTNEPTKTTDAEIVDQPVGLTPTSGHVSCTLDPQYVRCDINETDWTPPRPADCEFDYGVRHHYVGRGRAAMVCAGDTALNGGEPSDNGSPSPRVR
jgi:hypothetical protein